MSNKIYKDDQIVTSKPKFSIWGCCDSLLLTLREMIYFFAEIIACGCTFASGATMCSTVVHAINKQIEGAVVMAVCSIMFALVSMAIHSWLNYERKR